METKAGIETLAGYVSRELAPAIRDAAVWQEVHDALADHGLIIKKRGAGLVIGDEGLGIWCKASSANRDFSLTGLKKPLGLSSPLWIRRHKRRRNTPSNP